MKTQAEIVLKAKEYAESIGSKDGTVIYDYAMGYTQCQEDNKDKKYTKEDIKMMFNRYNEFIAHHDIEEWQPWINKQLNKQE